MVIGLILHLYRDWTKVLNKVPRSNKIEVKLGVGRRKAETQTSR